MPDSRLKRTSAARAPLSNSCWRGWPGTCRRSQRIRKRGMPPSRGGADSSMPDDTIARLRDVPTATAKQVLRELGVDRTLMLGLRALTSERRIAGKARTLRFLPLREDAKAPNKGVNRKLIDTLDRDDVLVIDAAGSMEGAVLGDMLAARVKARGAAGVVADGVIRDVDGIREIGLAVWARGTHPDANARALLAWETDVPVACGGVLVQPGDYVVADADGAVVVPPQHLE